MKKRFPRVPFDRLPYFFQQPRPGHTKRAIEHRSKPKPISNMTTVVCWDLDLHVGYDQVRELFEEISGVHDISFSSTKHRAVVHFATQDAAQIALYQLTGCSLMGRPLKFAWFDKNSYDLNRDALPVMAFLPARVRRSICVMGFDTSLSITQITRMLRSHFHLNAPHSERIITPENRDGTSTGKAFVCFKRYTDFVAALKLDGLDLGDGRKLCVTKWPEVLNFPWHYKEKGGGSVRGGSGSHVDAANWGTPSTGKRTVFESDDEF